MQLSSVILLVALLVSVAVAIPPFPFNFGFGPSAGGFDFGNIRIVTCSSDSDSYSLASVEVNSAVSTLTFALQGGQNAAITASYTGVNGANVVAISLLNTYDFIEEVNTTGGVVKSQPLDFQITGEGTANCAASGASLYTLSMQSQLDSGYVNLTCKITTKPQTTDGYALKPNLMKCDVYIGQYEYMDAGNKLQIIGKVGYNSASVTAGGLANVCTGTNGQSFCVSASGGFNAVVSFATTVQTGVSLAGSASVTVTSNTITGSAAWDAYSSFSVNTGTQVKILFNAAGESNIFWDPEIGITSGATTTTPPPPPKSGASTASVAAAVVALFSLMAALCL